jgi:hypothetical protein
MAAQSAAKQGRNMMANSDVGYAVMACRISARIPPRSGVSPVTGKARMRSQQA